jgi:hypothetical protein
VPLGQVPQVTQEAPYQVSVLIPDVQVGNIQLIALASDAQGNLMQDSITVVVKPTSSVSSLSVSPNQISFSAANGQVRSVSVMATFQDGTNGYVSTSPDTQYALSNPKVAVVNSLGQVQAQAPGIATLTVTYAGLSKALPVVVGVFPMRGDLNGDGAVDQNDIQILLQAVNTPSTGPGDPRDLNNDGRIDTLDAQILANLCSRPACATQNASVPSSKVSPLPTVETSPVFTVQWSGNDIGSVVQDYTIYVSDNGGPFVTWLINTASTQAPYTGLPGHVYGFYSIARDEAGNVENAKSSAETTTTVQPSAACAFTLVPSSASLGPSSSSSGFTITAADPTCAWTATSNTSFITVVSGASGMGNGNVGYSVGANSGGARSGTITAAGLTFSVNQQGFTCGFTLLPTSTSFPSQGGMGGFAVNATDSSCTWTANANDSWITLTTSSGTGSSPVTFTVATNLGIARSGTISVGGQIFVIQQESPCGASGCISISLSTNLLSFSFERGGPLPVAQYVTVTGGRGVPISTQFFNTPWLSISPATGQTPALLKFTVDPTGKSPGYYASTVQINPGNNVVTILFHVTDPPRLEHPERVWISATR